MVNPDLSAEWHPTRNGSVKPKDILPYSNKKVWWKCKKDHEWQAAPYNRSRGRGCAECWAEIISNKNHKKLVNKKKE